jgi:hypothetical protein
MGRRGLVGGRQGGRAGRVGGRRPRPAGAPAVQRPPASARPGPWAPAPRAPAARTRRAAPRGRGRARARLQHALSRARALAEDVEDERRPVADRDGLPAVCLGPRERLFERPKLPRRQLVVENHGVCAQQRDGARDLGDLACGARWEGRSGSGEEDDFERV